MRYFGALVSIIAFKGTQWTAMVTVERVDTIKVSIMAAATLRPAFI
jgi:hypothetical protein